MMSIVKRPRHQLEVNQIAVSSDKVDSSVIMAGMNADYNGTGCLSRVNKDIYMNIEAIAWVR